MSTDTYRGWDIAPPRWPKPWTATGPNFDADCDAGGNWTTSGGSVDADTREALLVKIDRWIEDNPDED